MQDIFKENLVYQNKDGIEYIQFKKLLQYPEITHCYTLKSNNKLNFPPVSKDEKTLKQSYEKIANALGIDANSIIKPHQTHTDRVEIVKNHTKLSEADSNKLDMQSKNENLKMSKSVLELGLDNVDGLLTNQKGIAHFVLESRPWFVKGTSAELMFVVQELQFQQIKSYQKMKF